ncbi:MAG TPA: hotdog domain-containing protein [Acidimicrobiales bacterium]|nr:hotdog domain-containing protein [Acidimicrobiales bacterium]
MKDSLIAGVTGTQTYTVTEDMKPGHLPVAVLSTPSMVQLIEMTCLATAQAHLDDGEVTVGTHVCVSHQGAAMAGQEITVDCRLAGVEKRRLNFEVRVEAPGGVISEGTHQRAVVDASRFG